MGTEANQQALEIVHEIWTDDCEILGDVVISELAKDPESFQSPLAGDHIDLGPILDTVKSALELVTACLALYAEARKAQQSSAEVEKKVHAKLNEAEGKGSLTRDQAVSLLKLVAGRD